MNQNLINYNIDIKLFNKILNIPNSNIQDKDLKSMLICYINCWVYLYIKNNSNLNDEAIKKLNMCLSNLLTAKNSKSFNNSLKFLINYDFK